MVLVRPPDERQPDKFYAKPNYGTYRTAHRQQGARSKESKANCLRNRRTPEGLPVASKEDNQAIGAVHNFGNQSEASKKKAVVAIARQLIVDLWRLKTGRVSAQELKLVMVGG